MRRSTLLLLAGLALIAALYWYLQQPGNLAKPLLNPQPTETFSFLGSLVNPSQGPVNRIALQDAAGNSLRLENAGQGWQAWVGEETAPVTADSTQAESAAAQTLSLYLVSRLTPPPPASASGLDFPAYQFSLTLVDGSEFRFAVGNQTVTGSGYYVGLEDGSVVIIGAENLQPLLGLLAAPPVLK